MVLAHTCGSCAENYYFAPPSYLIDEAAKPPNPVLGGKQMLVAIFSIRESLTKSFGKPPLHKSVAETHKNRVLSDYSTSYWVTCLYLDKNSQHKYTG